VVQRVAKAYAKDQTKNQPKMFMYCDLAYALTNTHAKAQRTELMEWVGLGNRWMYPHRFAKRCKGVKRGTGLCWKGTMDCVGANDATDEWRDQKINLV